MRCVSRVSPRKAIPVKWRTKLLPPSQATSQRALRILRHPGELDCELDAPAEFLELLPQCLLDPPLRNDQRIDEGRIGPRGALFIQPIVGRAA